MSPRELASIVATRMRARTVCAEPGCPALAEHRGRCPEHRAPNWRDAHQRDEQYGIRSRRPMRRLAERVRRRDRHRCQGCGAHVPPGAGAVDHRRPRSQGGATLEPNLWLLCDSCHDEKTRREARK